MAKVAPSRITRALAQTLASMISAEVSGITSRCSMVPCSRSRMSAAPVSTMPSRVTMLTICITARNHTDSPLGLKASRVTAATARGGSAR